MVIRNFEAMIRKVERASAGCVFVVSGEEYYQSERILQSLRKRAVDISYEVVRLMPEDLDEISLTALCSEGSLFSQGKLIILGNVDKISLSRKKELENIVSSGLEHILYCRTSGRKPSGAFIKNLESAGVGFTCWEPFSGSMWKWTKSLSNEEGISLTRAGAQAVESFASGKLERLADAIGKIALFHGRGSEVDAPGVHSALSGVVETSAFQFCDEVLSGKRGAAFSSLSILLDSGEEPIRLLALLYSQWKQVAAARELLHIGRQPKAVARKLGVPAFRWASVERYAARSVSCDDWVVLEAFAAADHGLKTGVDALAAVAPVVLVLTSVAG